MYSYLTLIKYTPAYLKRYRENLITKIEIVYHIM